MIELLFVVCLKSSPMDCEEKSLLYVDGMTPKACLMQAQPELARWADTHPQWTIRRWRCENPDTTSASL